MRLFGINSGPVTGIGKEISITSCITCKTSLQPTVYGRSLNIEYRYSDPT
jgi:hypothetical protein